MVAIEVKLSTFIYYYLDLKWLREYNFEVNYLICAIHGPFGTLYNIEKITNEFYKSKNDIDTHLCLANYIDFDNAIIKFEV